MKLTKKLFYICDDNHETLFVDQIWRTDDQLIDEVKKLKPAKMITHAFIFDKDSKHVWTFASYDSEAAVFSDCNVLLRSSVTKLERVLNRSE